jgi:hypothetical protein
LKRNLLRGALGLPWFGILWVAGTIVLEKMLARGHRLRADLPALKSLYRKKSGKPPADLGPSATA